MRIVHISMFMVLYTCCSFSQTLSDGLLINGLKFRTEKREIIRVLGQPNKTYNLEYECGFLSTTENGKTFESLKYDGLVATGMDGELYVFETILLNSKFKITYNGRQISSEDSFDKLLSIFGEEIMNSIHESYTGEELVRNEKSDDGLILHLKDGKLQKIEYWSPC